MMSEVELQQELDKLYSYEDTFGKEDVDVRKKEYPFSLYTDVDKGRKVDFMPETDLLESGIWNCSREIFCMFSQFEMIFKSLYIYLYLNDTFDVHTYFIF